jgi:four helix bundle protein
MENEKPNPAKDKSFEFALKIIKVCRKLQVEDKEFVLSNQLLRSGTSIGANVEEGVGSFSDRDFHFKFSIAYKEARETHYWIRLLSESGFIKDVEAHPLLENAEELLKIIGSILRTMRNKMKGKK